MTKRRVGIVSCVIVLCAGVAILAVGQDPGVAQPVEDSAATAIEQILTYIDSAANYLGQGVLYVLNLITNDRVSSDLQEPIGYLAFITIILLLFGILDFARKVIWIGIIVGWVLLIVRVILDALNV
ncbi:MAG: hypothetical protein JSW65_05325 [Candidatus Bipolaricaulota bacterium]|nr:MAG: hypothetical protein JSW65_05325 [Candidatus Bipolaricaulota bacterium]